MYSYPIEKLKTLFETILQKNLSAEGWKWLEEEKRAMVNTFNASKFGVAFVVVPRKTGKAPATVSQEDIATLADLRPGLSIEAWTVDQLSRVWLILHLDVSDPEFYSRTIENLFLNAEMNELVALYSALPLLAYPEHWKKRCSEGIRSNIGRVLETIMCRNPYPAEQLDEPAWNQLVLKAIFTEKPLLEIYHLRERANRELAGAISAFAHERWAAHRAVNPLVWIAVENFVDDNIVKDVERLAYSTDSNERKAAALVCASSSFTPAKSLIKKNPELKKILEEESVSWRTLAYGLETSGV